MELDKLILKLHLEKSKNIQGELRKHTHTNATQGERRSDQIKINSKKIRNENAKKKKKSPLSTLNIDDPWTY